MTRATDALSDMLILRGLRIVAIINCVWHPSFLPQPFQVNISRQNAESAEDYVLVASANTAIRIPKSGTNTSSHWRSTSWWAGHPGNSWDEPNTTEPTGYQLWHRPNSSQPPSQPETEVQLWHPPAQPCSQQSSSSWGSQPSHQSSSSNAWQTGKPKNKGRQAAKSQPLLHCI